MRFRVPVPYYLLCDFRKLNYFSESELRLRQVVLDEKPERLRNSRESRHVCEGMRLVCETWTTSADRDPETCLG